MIRPPTSKWYTHIREIATGVADFFFLVWWIIIRPLVIWITSKLLLDMRFLLLLTAIIFAWASASCQTTQRIKLTQLERSAIVEGSRSGQIGLTNANGDQRYTQYVEVNLTPIAYVPTATGNTQNLSEFVTDPAGDIWYIDWQGNAQQLYNAACDADWLVIGNNTCPDAITDSIYHYKYAAVGARYVWPNAEHLVSDSVGVGISGISGNRNARLFLYDQGSTGSFTIDHGGTSTILYIEQGGELRVATSSGTADTPLLQTNHFAVTAADSTVQMHRYPQTRNDSGTPVNILSTDAQGKVRSHPLSEVQQVKGAGTDNQVAFWADPDSLTGDNRFTFNRTDRKLLLANDTFTTRNINAGFDSATDAWQLRLLGRSDIGGFHFNHNWANANYTQVTANYGTLNVGFSTPSQAITTGSRLGFYKAQTSTLKVDSAIAPVLNTPIAQVNTFMHRGQTSSLISAGSIYDYSNGARWLESWIDSVAADGTVATRTEFYTKDVGGGSIPQGNLVMILNKAGRVTIPYYPSSRNDSGTPVNVLTTDVNGNIQSHPVGELPGGVSGSGATNRAAIWSGASTLSSADSILMFNTGPDRVAIGATSAVARLQVNGSGATSSTNTAVFHNSTGSSNTLVVRDDGRIGLGTNAPNAQFMSTESVANTITLADRMIIQTNSTGTPAIGFGGRILFQGESSTTNNRDMAAIGAVWSTATDASRTGDRKSVV